ncbi:hypothetical protein EOI86_06140 [Hwanghaeella grinnelliae]|uniref:Cytochrome oxidase subunit I profile domain-containing protein n=1 Tax=Hwanghaeella grinnelliae TaxID=2500179 RepID=A0A3S2W721_9PROT|nr:hypothetical protein [Hwanghaeella grinnelliae]RVU38843.1 hypothetical protein EOI86_06140 [Hwanghaeella grinnelliae]
MHLLGGFGITSLFISANIPVAVLLGSDGQNGIFLDTSYVVASFHTLIAQLLVIFILAAITWVQDRFHAMRFPRISRWLFWPFFTSIAALNSNDLILQLTMSQPHRYIDYADGFELYNQISLVSAYTALMAMVAILALAIWSAYARWRFGKIESSR